MAGLFAVRARLRTRDGREAVGWAEGGYPRRTARSWLGHTVEAWHDPRDPSRFRLHPPQSARQARSSLVLRSSSSRSSWGASRQRWSSCPEFSRRGLSRRGLSCSEFPRRGLSRSELSYSELSAPGSLRPESCCSGLSR